MKKITTILQNTSKRGLAAFLVICLFIGMLPTQILTAFAIEKPTFHIDFRTCSAMGHFARVDHAKLSDHGWEYNEGESVIGTDNKFFQMKKEGLSYRSATSNWGNKKNECITLNINVPENGLYDLKVITGKNNDAGLTDLYIDNQKIGQYDANGKSEECTMSDPLPVGEVKLTKGVHQLKIQFVQRVEIRLAELQFFKKADVAAVEWDFSLCNPSGHLAAITHAKLSDHGWEYNEAASKPGDKPKFLQLKREDLAYRADTSLWSDSDKYITLDVNVPENGVYDLRLIAGKNADSGKIDVFFDDQKVGQYDAYDASATSDKCSWSDMLNIGSVTLKAGVHQLKFQVLNRLELRVKKVALYKTADLTVLPDFSIDFKECHTKGHATDVKHATLADHNWQFDEASSSAAKDFRWIQMMSDSFGARPNDWIGGADQAKEIVMDINIPETGTYKMDIISAVNIDGANTEVYLDGHKIGQYNSRDPKYPDSSNSGIGSPFTMDLITVTKGIHKLKFKAIYNYEIRPSCLQFYKQEVSDNKITLQTTPLESTAVGETHNISLQAIYGGRPFLGAVLENLTAESDNKTIATAKIVTVGEQQKVAVTGVNAGTTKIKIQAMIGGINVLAEVPVNIEEERRTDGYIIDFTKCHADGHSSDPDHAVIGEHNWQLRRDLSSDKSMYRYINMTEFGLRARSNKWLNGKDPVRNLVIDVNIPKDGFYYFDMVTAMNQDVGKSRVYLDGVHQTEINGYVAGANYSLSKPIKVGYYYLTKGVHSIRFELWYNTEIYPAKFSFYSLKNEEVQMSVGTVSAMNVDVTEEIPIQVQTVKDKNNLNTKDMHFEVVSENTEIATAEAKLNKEGTEKVLAVTAHSAGATNLTVRLMNGTDVIATQNVPITVKEMTFDHISLEVPAKVLGMSQEGMPIEVICWDNDGRKLNNSHATITFESSNENVATVMWDHKIYPVSPGDAIIKATATIGDISHNAEVEIHVRNRKTESTIYTPEKIAAARENIEKYSWARIEAERSIKAAEKYLGQEEYLWNSVTTQELPRSITVGWRLDPNAYTCRYCGADLRAKFGLYPWVFDALNMPWKIQCPDCRRKFPSNDFENYYKLGLDEHGIWSYERAKQKNAELVAEGKDGYLKNVLYPEKDRELNVENWGVDDGWGYNTGKTIDVGGGRVVEDSHSYIAYYNHWALWNYQMLSQKGMIQDALQNLSMAYLYTGDERYGKVGAILIDRVADIYPSLYTEPYCPAFFPNYHRGKAADMTWETGNAKNLVRSYDILFPMMENPQVIQFLSDKAEKYQLDNKKSTATDIRNNCEDGILREVYKSAREGNLSGNFGMHQSTVVDAAVALDCMPDTKNMIDWAFQTGVEINDGPASGGNVIKRLIDDVSRDGLGNEAAPGYNVGWIGNLRNMADTLAAYPGFEEANLYKYPKYIKMFSGAFPMILCRRYTPSIGDSGLTAGLGIEVYKINLIRAFQETGDIQFAQFLYALNGNSVEGIRGDIFTKNPEAIQQQILDIIDEHGEYAGFDQSSQMAGYGFTALRSGSYYPAGAASQSLDTQRDFWMYYGIGVGKGSKHGHGDGLNLGMEAYGLNIAPDFGYPESCDGGDKYNNWNMSTISHNTVQVDDKRQTGITYNGKPMHFNDAGRVKVMDVDAPEVYNSTDIYRRTVVMVDVSDEISYGIDFFHVRGGDDHLYSFHALSQEIAETEGLNLVKQVDSSGNYVGSYAGPEVPYGATGYSSGYSWLTKVRKDTNPKNGEFAVDFKIIKNFRDVHDTAFDLNLRMTMLNNFKLNEVSIVNAIPPQRDGNPTYVEKVLARRTGENLDTLFTTVFEPYRDARYIKALEQVPVTRADGSLPAENEMVKAVRVTLEDGRTDYILYAQNNQIEYRIDNKFNFKGFVGVYTLSDGQAVYSYLNDGTKLDDMTGVDAYTGKVTNFTKELSLENKMTVSFDGEVDVDRLANNFIYVENDGKQNAAYPIYGAIKNADGTVTLDLGDMTMIRSSKEVVGLNATYNYNIAEGQIFRIPLATVGESVPVFEKISDKSIEVGSELKFEVHATSANNRELTYSAKDLPRGAQFDSRTNTFTWIPDVGQLGRHHISFEVTDGITSVTTHANITVYSNTSTPPSGGGIGPVTPPEKPDDNGVKFETNNKQNVTVDTADGKVIFPAGSLDVDGTGKLDVFKNDTTINIQTTVNNKAVTFKKPVYVALNYQANANRKDLRCIVVENEKGDIIPRCIYRDNKIIFEADQPGNYKIVYRPKTFTDLVGFSWAEDAIIRLAARNVIYGVTKDTFVPEKQITRADFTVLIARTFGLKAKNAVEFSDVSSSAYYAEAVAAAQENGIVFGFNGEFRPNDAITREDLAVILARVIEQSAMKFRDDKKDVSFVDAASISKYATEAVTKLAQAGLLVGDHGQFKPKGKATRAEVAVILDRFLIADL